MKAMGLSHHKKNSGVKPYMPTVVSLEPSGQIEATDISVLKLNQTSMTNTEPVSEKRGLKKFKTYSIIDQKGNLHAIDEEGPSILKLPTEKDLVLFLSLKK
jgi:hypothetical protein